MANVRISGFTGGAYANMKDIIESELKRGAPVVPVAGESAVLGFEQWTLRWCADNGRKLSQTEYGIAMAAFYSAHPAEGPFSHTMSGDTREAGIREAAAECVRISEEQEAVRSQTPFDEPRLIATGNMNGAIKCKLAILALLTPPEQPTKE